MGTDRLPPGTGTEPDDASSWDGDAVKSLQAGRLQLAQGFPLSLQSGQQPQGEMQQEHTNRWSSTHVMRTRKMTITHHRSRLGHSGGYFSHESRGDSPNDKKIRDEERAKRVQEEELAEGAGEGEERGWVNNLTRQVRDVRQVGRGPHLTPRTTNLAITVKQ